MILHCATCDLDTQIGDTYELHDGLRLPCPCGAVTVVRLEQDAPTVRGIHREQVSTNCEPPHVRFTCLRCGTRREGTMSNILAEYDAFCGEPCPPRPAGGAAR